MRRIPFSVLSVLGLATGLTVGLLSHGSDSAILLAVVAAAKTIGSVWTHLLQATIVPLVIGLVAARIMDVRPSQMGRLGTATVLSTVIVGTILIVLAGAASRVALLALPDATAAAEALRSGATQLAALRPNVPPRADNWVDTFIPVNVVRAAAEGSMLQLLVFVTMFALAARTLPVEQRTILQQFCEALGNATLVIVRWLMRFVPIGVAALVIPLTAQLGTEIVGALARITGLVLLTAVGLILSLYVVVPLLARVSPWAFAKAAAPGQAIALTTRSSLAAFPAMMKGAHDHLPLPSGTIDFLLPLITFNVRMSRAVNMMEFVLIGTLAGMNVGYGMMAAYLVSKLGVKAGRPGLPSTGKSSFAVMVALGMPIEAALLVTAIAPIVDPISTTLNVTGDMAITTIAGRLGLAWEGNRDPSVPVSGAQPVVAS